MTKREEDILRCSFCNKSQREVKKLIAGPAVFICDECVQVCLDIINEDERLSAEWTAADGITFHSYKQTKRSNP